MYIYISYIHVINAYISYTYIHAMKIAYKRLIHGKQISPFQMCNSFAITAL